MYSCQFLLKRLLQEEGSELGNFVEDKNSVTPDKKTENSKKRKHLKSMDSLNEREQMTEVTL